jgi:hypothetical protein
LWVGRLLNEGYVNVNTISNVGQTPKISNIIQFGSNENQTYHSFRHVDAMGLDRTLVREAVINDISLIADQIEPGQTFIDVLSIEGHHLQYNAHLLPNGIINIRRINAIP